MTQKIIEIAKTLMRIKSVSGNLSGIQDILSYCTNYFKNTKACVRVYQEIDISPVLVISNKETESFDVAVLGHLDVVPADEEMFEPVIRDGKLYGRGGLDMKAWVAASFQVMEDLLSKGSDKTFAIILTTDEETKATGAKYLTDKTKIKIKTILDVDVAGNISEIVTRCKCPLFIKLVATGVNAHGSLPWEGSDANERLMQTIINLRQHFPYYDKDAHVPDTDWVSTMHVGTFSGGSAVNVISEYAEANLDFRLTEQFPLEQVYRLIDEALVTGVSYTVQVEGLLIQMDENNPDLLRYKQCVEEITGQPARFVSMGGATDSRHFFKKGVNVIMHSGSGAGMHSKDEFCLTDSIVQMYQIQTAFLKS